MTKTRSHLWFSAIPFMALVLFFCGGVWAADISGTWTIMQKNNEGVDDSFDVAIRTVSEKLTITGNHSKIGALSGTGTLKGDEITMTINAEGAQGKGALSFDYTGKVSGNKMSGTKETKMSGTPGSQGGAPPGGGKDPAGSAPAMGQDGAPGAAGGTVSKAWTAIKK